MGEILRPFAPGWVTPPGGTIEDILEERGWPQSQLAERLGYSTKHVSQLINGKAPITQEIALKLEKVLGGTSSFWQEREAQYRARLAVCPHHDPSPGVCQSHFNQKRVILTLSSNFEVFE